ncbi:non-oxidative hydroxyarylic acid decarboxylases subunit D [Nocardiopsis sp. JB363]|uniref:non-oxidative hydroxyarylic acid decarboxylases subunit D n=1 Tax=Nocardiopsis sp. JB363 TaxID=1434837 RepID=UPI00097B36C4|nr:non-oxidative hydroxyarylic acid decarboxylases subunit D [Nocardiopsis sp. JB363]SIO88792.1 Hydroxyaromatic non-oxidative decarboxylase protein D [Nocardiopsis sp. JB363]
MICPRCGDEGAATVAVSPVPGVWEVVLCSICHYTWRTTEPPRQSVRESFPEEFRITPEDIRDAVELPPVPPLRDEPR